MTDVEVAFHEAGHAVVGVLLGLPLLDVKIERNEKSLGQARFDTVDPSKWLAEALMIAAGPEAWMRLTGCSVPSGHDSDRDNIREIFELRVAEIERSGAMLVIGLEERIRRALKQSASLVDQYWPWIDAVAYQLHERTYLTGFDVKQLRKPPRTPSQALAIGSTTTRRPT